jgi:uncharacterized protein (UPF0335 family)
LKREISLKIREYLRRKVLETFEEEISNLSKDFKEVLADDLVTAFENRMAILMKIQSKELMKKKD